MRARLVDWWAWSTPGIVLRKWRWRWQVWLERHWWPTRIRKVEAERDYWRLLVLGEYLTGECEPVRRFGVDLKEYPPC